MARPQTGDYGSFYQGYIDAATGNSVSELLEKHPAQIRQFILDLPEDKADYQYAAGKWTIKQMLQHLIDTERVFTYRALRISRKDTTALAGFDEKAYAENAPVNHRSLQELKQEFILLRQASDMMVASFTNEQLSLEGVASNHPITVNALCFIIFGHNLHHMAVMKERYL